MKKFCTKCKTEKDLSEFYISKSGRTVTPCKSCLSENSRKWRVAKRKKEERISKLNPEHLMWFFWNNCRAAKRYPRRNPAANAIKNRRGVKVHCSKCGCEMVGYGAKFAAIESSSRELGQLCRGCREKELEDYNKEIISSRKAKSEQLSHKFKSALEDCNKFGTCDIIRAHHEAFIEDGERLTSEFLIKMICGDGKVNNYKDLSGVSTEKAFGRPKKEAAG